MFRCHSCFFLRDDKKIAKLFLFFKFSLLLLHRKIVQNDVVLWQIGVVNV